MSAKDQSSSLGKKLGLAVGILLAAVTVFIVVMCSAGQTKALESPADFPAPNN